MRRQVAVLLLIILSFLVGCSRPDRVAGRGSPEDAGTPVPGDWVIVRYEAEPENLNPLTHHTTYASYILYGANFSQIAETMLQYDPKDWSFTKPLLAESYPEISPDHLVYTFMLRDGIKWHDGRPFTPEDVLFSAKAVICPLVDAAPVRSTVTDLINVEVLEGRRIRFTMRKPYFMNDIQLGSLFLVPKHVFDEEGLLDGFSFKDMIGPKGTSDSKIKKFAEQFNKHPRSRQPLGTGPYKFEKWDTGKEIVLVRNEDYWGQKPFLDKILIRMILDSPAALTALKSGEIDFNPVLLPIQYAQQTSGANFERQFVKARYSIPQYYYIGWNQERPYFKDKRVRQALTMLVNRQQIIETLRFGLAKIAASPFNPSSPDFDPNIQPLPYDPKRAAELLDEAGWKDHDGDGIRDKDGVPFKFEFQGSAASSFTSQLLPILKEEFRKAGIETTERRLEFTVFIENMKDHKYDAGLSAWVSDLISDPYQLWHSSSIANRGSNYVSFRNAEVDKLLEQARTAFDPSKRQQLYWRFQEIIHEEQPYTFLFYPEQSAAYDRRFQNGKFIPPRPGYDLSAWFVPKLTQKYTVTNTP